MPCPPLATHFHYISEMSFSDKTIMFNDLQSNATLSTLKFEDLHRSIIELGSPATSLASTTMAKSAYGGHALKRLF